MAVADADGRSFKHVHNNYVGLRDACKRRIHHTQKCAVFTVMSVVVVHKSCFLKKRQFTTMSTTTAGFESKRGTPKFNVHWMKLLGYLRSSTTIWLSQSASALKGKGSPYKTTECRFPELIPVLGSQPAGDVSHKPGGRLPLLSARPAVTPATLKRAATNFAAW